MGESPSSAIKHLADFPSLLKLVFEPPFQLFGFFPQHSSPLFAFCAPRKVAFCAPLPPKTCAGNCAPRARVFRGANGKTLGRRGPGDSRTDPVRSTAPQCGGLGVYRIGFAVLARSRPAGARRGRGPAAGWRGSAENRRSGVRVVGACMRRRHALRTAVFPAFVFFRPAARPTPPPARHVTLTPHSPAEKIRRLGRVSVTLCMSHSPHTHAPKKVAAWGAWVWHLGGGVGLAAPGPGAPRSAPGGRRRRRRRVLRPFGGGNGPPSKSRSGLIRAPRIAESHRP